MEYLESDDELLDENDYLHIDTDPPNYDWVPGSDELSSKISQNFIDLENYYIKLYLKLEDKLLIAKYKCDEIFEDIDCIIKMSNSHFMDIINHAKKIYSKDTDLTKILEDNIRSCKTLFEEVHLKKNITQRRKNF